MFPFPQYSDPGWPAWARLSLSLAGALAAFGPAYGLYSLAFGV